MGVELLGGDEVRPVRPRRLDLPAPGAADRDTAAFVLAQRSGLL